MSHVDDGELTAYADGAYPVDDPVALRISAHLSACGNCRTRLEQNQDLRTRASEILAYATPAVREAPAFETLEHKLATSPAPRRRAIPLAWAATVIMALGLGWFGRGMLQAPPGMREMAVQDQPAAATAADAIAPSTTQTQPMVESARDARSTPPTLAADNRGVAQDNLVTEQAARGNIAGNAVVGSAAPEAAALEASGAGARNMQAPPSAPVTAPAPAPFALSLEPGAVEVITPAEAERRNLDLPRVPELPIERILVTGNTTTVEQRLPDGKIVSLLLTAPRPVRAEADQAEARKSTQRSVAPVAPSTGVTVQVRGRTVMVLGELPRDSLRMLGDRIR